jgi:hypothetical protein
MMGWLDRFRYQPASAQSRYLPFATVKLPVLQRVASQEPLVSFTNAAIAADANGSYQ